MTRIKRLAKEGSWIVVGQIATVAGALWCWCAYLPRTLDPARSADDLLSALQQVLQGVHILTETQLRMADYAETVRPI
jgi:hypothetical protein